MATQNEEQLKKQLAEAQAKATKAAKRKTARKAEANQPQFPGSHRGY